MQRVFAIGLQHVSPCPLGVSDGKFADILVAKDFFRVDRSHQVCEDHLERVLDFVIDRLAVSQLVALRRGAGDAI